MLVVNRYKCCYCGACISVCPTCSMEPKDIFTCAQFPVEDESIDPNYCEFYFGSKIAPDGYIWVFPKGGHLAMWE